MKVDYTHILKPDIADHVMQNLSISHVTMWLIYVYVIVCYTVSLEVGLTENLCKFHILLVIHGFQIAEIFI